MYTKMTQYTHVCLQFVSSGAEQIKQTVSKTMDFSYKLLLYGPLLLIYASHLMENVPTISNIRPLTH